VVYRFVYTFDIKRGMRKKGVSFETKGVFQNDPKVENCEVFKTILGEISKVQCQETSDLERSFLNFKSDLNRYY